jgi:hypothetical protein
MRRISRVAVVIAATGLIASMAAPVAAVDVDPELGYANVVVEVVNYTVGDFVFGGQIACGSLHAPIDIGVGDTESGPIELPVGATCWVEEFTGGDPGELGQWGIWTVSPSEATIVAGQLITFNVHMEREYNGNEPRWDFNDWLPMEVFTVDRVYVNRSGGITAEGLVLCAALAASPAGSDPIINVNWSATQYVGRKTAIHGSYGSDIGNFCYDSEHPTTPVRWRSMHPSGDEAVTAWVYGVDGKFASGTVIVDADALNDMSSITQYWDPDLEGYDPEGCTPAFKENGGYDQNGDGFCAYSIWSGQRTTAAVKTTSLKGR